MDARLLAGLDFNYGNLISQAKQTRKDENMNLVSSATVFRFSRLFFVFPG
jgi:hypothetical protein